MHGRRGGPEGARDSRLPMDGYQRLASDVNPREEEELRRLEAGVGGGEEDMPPTVEDLGRGDGADDISDVDSEELNQRVQEAETACGHACSPAEAGARQQTPTFDGLAGLNPYCRIKVDLGEQIV